MHRRDALERLVTKHPGSHSHRKHMKPDKRRRRSILRRRTQDAKMATLNTAITSPESSVAPRADDEAILDEGAE